MHKKVFFLLSLACALVFVGCQKGYLRPSNETYPRLDTLVGKFKLAGDINTWTQAPGGNPDSVMRNYRYVNRDTIILTKISDTVLRAQLTDQGVQYSYILHYAPGCVENSWCYTSYKYPDYSNSVTFYKKQSDSVSVYFSSYVPRPDGYAFLLSGHRVH